MSALSCLSCAHHRPERCVQGMKRWPDERLEWCPMACYEHGADEREDWDMAAIEAARSGEREVA